VITGAPPADDPRLQKIHERALAAINYRDAFNSMEAARGHVGQHQWDQAAASFIKALDQLPNELAFWSPARPLCEEIARQPEVFERLIELRPRDARLWFARGHNFVREREWVKASSDLSRTMDFGKWDRPAIGMLIELAAVSLLAGDESAYTAFCQKVVREYGTSDDPFAASAAARVCTLSPKGATDWSILIRCADTAIQSAPGVPWYVYSAGAAHYRAGHNEEAVQFLKRSLESHPRWKGRGQNYVMLALACEKLGRLDEARGWLVQTERWLDEMRRTLGNEDFDVSASAYVTDWLSVEVLFREAEALITSGGNR
jgi:tetratricopeptide (TPR) repeat protein